MAKGQTSNHGGHRPLDEEVVSDDEVVADELLDSPPDHDPLAAGGTVVTSAPEPPARPVRSAAPRRSESRPVLNSPEFEADLDQDQPNPLATRILNVDAMEAPVRFEMVVTEGRSRGTHFALRPGVHTVGRSSQCDCSLLDEAVSRRHFELTVESRGVSLRDLGSGNGTLLNGSKTDEALLEHGDLLRVGDTSLEFRERGKPQASGSRAGAVASGRAAAPAMGRTTKGGKFTESQRKLLLGVLAVFALTILFVAFARVRARNRAIQRSTLAFERGRQDLEQGNADDAIDEFQQALVAYPNPDLIRERLATAQLLSEGGKSLARARDLIDQKDFDGAHKALDAIPKSPLLDAQVKDARASLEKREADARAEQAVRTQAGLPVDPTTLAEAKELRDKAQREGRGNLEGASEDMGRAYQMLASRGAGGPDFEQIRASYLDLLKQIFQRYRRSNPSKAALAVEQANAITPDAIRPDDIGTSAPTAAVHHGSVKHRRPSSHPTGHHTPLYPAHPVSTPAHGAGHHYDENRAEELDDEGDALLGQDPDAAKRKYQEALKFAPPGGDAAQHAQQGLSP